MIAIHIDRMASPLGTLLLAHAGGQLCMLDFEDFANRFAMQLARRFGNLPVTEAALPGSMRQALNAYLDGDLEAVDSIPVHTAGTSFQQQVWQTLRHIPAGATWTYSQLAEAIGRPGAQRAVGLANSQNPVAIVLPCHRVIGSSGELTGYAGGLHRKRWLLSHEGIALPLHHSRQADLFQENFFAD